MILPYQLRPYGCSQHAEDDTTALDGMIDTGVTVSFTSIGANGQLQIVSSDDTDTASVRITGRLQNGSIVQETLSLTGQTPAPTAQTAWERVMKAEKLASTAGVVAVEAVTATLTGTLASDPGSPTDRVNLASAASSIDETYTGSVIRFSNGTVARILLYFGSTRLAILDQYISGLSGATTYRISPGAVFTIQPVECFTVRQLFYNAVADISSGVTRYFYEKFFWQNDSLELLTNVEVQEAQNPLAQIEFGIDPALGSTLGSQNRRTPPVGVAFSRLSKSVSDMPSTSCIGVWLKLSLPAGASPSKSLYASRLRGITV